MSTNDTSKHVQVDIFQLPQEEAEQFRHDREYFMHLARTIMYEYCPIVKVERFDPTEGESVSGYITEDSQRDRTPVLSVVLDPFEVAAMKVALERDKLKEYIFAASNMTEPLLKALKKEFGVEK